MPKLIRVFAGRTACHFVALVVLWLILSALVFLSGTTTVLTMTFIGLDNRNDLPKVNYSTALDVYVAMCFVFVLATIIQFASVHYYTKFGCGEGPETNENNARKDDEIANTTDVEVK